MLNYQNKLLYFLSTYMNEIALLKRNTLIIFMLDCV